MEKINYRKLRLSLGSRNSRRASTKSRFGKGILPKTMMKALIRELKKN